MAEKADKSKKRNPVIRLFRFLLCLVIGAAALLILGVAGVNLYMFGSSSGKIITEEKAAELSDVDYVLVLGASVHAGTPSTMLKDRLDTAVSVGEKNQELKLLMSGDSSDQYYDEVGTMKDYLVENGISEDRISTDPLGLCTYDSMKRAVKEYSASKIVIVTQRYHMYRALFVARRLGLEAYGVCAPGSNYTGQRDREIREIAARCKDFLMIIFGEENTHLLGNLVLQTKIIGEFY